MSEISLDALMSFRAVDFSWTMSAYDITLSGVGTRSASSPRKATPPTASSLPTFSISFSTVTTSIGLAAASRARMAANTIWCLRL